MRKVKESSACTTIDISGRVEVLHARYYTHSFSPHWHEEYAIGLVDAGVEQFHYRGATHHAGISDIVLLNAGDVHTGEAADERGFGFRMLYLPERTLRELSLDNIQVKGTLRFFGAVQKESAVSRSLTRAHRSLELGASALEVESLFTVAISNVLVTASSWNLPELLPGAPAAIVSARDYLHDHLFEDVSLTDLASEANISKFSTS